MEVKIEVRDSAKIVLVKGDVDMSSSRRLREVLKELTNKKEKRIVIDLAQMPYIDSAGLATLVECYQETKKYKGDLRLADLSTNVREVFRLARLDTIFDIYPNTDEALVA